MFFVPVFFLLYFRPPHFHMLLFRTQYSAHSALRISFVTEPDETDISSSTCTLLGISPAHLFNLSNSLDPLALEPTAAIAHGVHEVVEYKTPWTSSWIVSLMTELATQKCYIFIWQVRLNITFILQEKCLYIKGIGNWS